MPLVFTEPQLAQLLDATPMAPGWVFEVKYDGYRLQALIEKGKVRLLTRRGHDWTEKFAPITAALAKLPAKSAVLDGEVIALSKGGESAFGALQNQFDAPGSVPLQFIVFDLLYLNGTSLKPHPLHERWELLQLLLKKAKATSRSVVRLSERLKGNPESLIHTACARHLEGIIAKRNDATYQSGRGGSWVKVKCTGRQEFVIVGFTPPGGSRVGIGSLLLAVNDGKSLRYAGRVGSGFTDVQLDSMLKRLEKVERKASPLSQVPKGMPRDVRWVKPVLVAEVTFTEWTADGALRHPVFVGLRNDKPATEIRRERSTPMAKATKKSATSTDNVVAGVTISHPERVVYPEAGITKLDLARYLERVAPLMLPHVANRPLSLVRCPEGTAGECFFQKHWSGKLPPRLDTVAILQSDGKTHPHTMIHDVTGLVTLAQWGVLEIHPWGSRADDPEKPDRVIFDLDPDPEVTWGAVREAARALQALLEELGLECWLKTSGGKGLHVVVPVARKGDWDAVSAFARAVAEHMATVLPDHFVSKASKAVRKGKIFIDWLRNTRGATAVAPWSPRARPAAGISVPISWELLGRLKSGDQYTLTALPTMPKSDPWAALLRSRQSLTKRIIKQLQS